MTDRIDLDDLDVGESSEAGEAANEADWFWRGEGEPPEPAESVDGPEEDESTAAADDGAERRLPGVPRKRADGPVGIPTDSGGSGAGAVPEEGAGAATEEGAGVGASAPAEGESGPHGGGADDLTLAVTYGAIRRLADPGAAMADASGWSDWVGIVGDVDAHVIHTFQRRNGVDADFFNGTGTGPDERLAEIGPRSMFYADRMVLVGIEGEDERTAAAAGWEFVPLVEAAAKAGWELSE